MSKTSINKAWDKDWLAKGSRGGCQYVDEHGYTVIDDTMWAADGPRLTQMSRAIKRLMDAREALMKKSRESLKQRNKARSEYWSSVAKRKPLGTQRRWRPVKGQMKKPTNFKQVPWNKNQLAGWQKFVQFRKK